MIRWIRICLLIWLSDYRHYCKTVSLCMSFANKSLQNKIEENREELWWEMVQKSLKFFFFFFQTQSQYPFWECHFMSFEIYSCWFGVNATFLFEVSQVIDRWFMNHDACIAFQEQILKLISKVTGDQGRSFKSCPRISVVSTELVWLDMPSLLNLPKPLSLSWKYLHIMVP